MKRFEYLVIKVPERNGVRDINVDELSKLGQEGWEIISFVHDGSPPFFLAKREKG